MKRNWDTIRKIMLAVEAMPDEGSTLASADVTGIDSEAVFYHMRLLIESSLAVGNCPEMLSGPSHGWLTRLTWDGHELLDNIRRDTVWNKIKETARIKGVDLGMDTVKAIAAIVAGKLIS